MKLKNIKGLKYPDEYIIKFFFSKNLHVKKNLNVLELGCGNGSNLMLPYDYENNVTGIDYDPTLIEYAKHNYQLISTTSNYNFEDSDIRTYVANNFNLEIDLLLLPSVIYYINKSDFITLMDNIISNQLIKKSIPFYIRFRTNKDFRFGLGEKLEDNCYRMPEDNITGEANATITFYTESEMLNLLQKHLNLTQYKIFHLNNENYQNGMTILNSDIVIWGTIN